MKKYLIISSFALLAFVSAAAAQSYAFSNSLYIGSTGSDVVNLQTWLISHGFSIPAIVSGEAAKGYFGIQTQNALEAYQLSVGLPATGFFGPLTIAKIDGSTVVISPANPITPILPTAPINLGGPMQPVTTGSPVINGVTAPTTLAVNQTGTWIVNAYDPQNGYLSYSVNWGDTGCFYPYSCAATNSTSQQAYAQNSTFTHSYASAGTYTVTFVVRDSAGLTNQTSSTVTVTNNGTITPTGSLRVISPNGGEDWAIGTTQNITWTSSYYSGYSGYSGVSTVDIKLVPYQQPCTGQQACPLYVLAPYTIVTNIPASQDYYSWIVGNAAGYTSYPSNTQTIPAGQYTIQICQSGTSNCDSSDGTFTITSSGYTSSSGYTTYPTYPTYTASNPNQCPAGYTCTSNTPVYNNYSQCPAGYTCTSNAPTTYPTVQCPAGYICSANNSGTINQGFTTNQGYSYPTVQCPAGYICTPSYQ